MQRESERVEREWHSALAGMAPPEILAWAHARFGEGLILACSFGGTSGMALLDMAAKALPKLAVFTLDTGFLFDETIQTRERAAAHYQISPRVMTPLLPGPDAPRLPDPDSCCARRKVEPTRRALAGRAAWVVGLRRDQSEERAEVLPITWDEAFGLYKIAPLWDWTEAQVRAYLEENDVPVNPLHARGYGSIGCWPCTRALSPGESLRAGRWDGLEKTECGLHGGKK